MISLIDSLPVLGLILAGGERLLMRDPTSGVKIPMSCGPAATAALGGGLLRCGRDPQCRMLFEARRGKKILMSCGLAATPALGGGLLRCGRDPQCRMLFE